jgi:hypothetical protein
LPNGIPGMGEEIDGAMQHAPQRVRHSMNSAALTSGAHAQAGTAAGADLPCSDGIRRN